MNIDGIRLRYPFRYRDIQHNIQITVYRHHSILQPAIVHKLYRYMISPHLHLTQLPSQTGRADRRNGVHVPDDKLPIHPRRADLCDLSRHARVWPHAGNRVLMNGEQLRPPDEAAVGEPGALEIPRSAALRKVLRQRC